MGAPMAGWYLDPHGGPRRRYWDGSQWTDHYAEPELSTTGFPLAYAAAWVVVPVLVLIFIMVQNHTPTGAVVEVAFAVAILASIFVSLIRLAFRVDERRKKHQQTRERNIGLAVNADIEDAAYRAGDDLRGMHGQFPPTT